MKPKYRYIIICSCFQPIMFNSDGGGQWVGKSGKKLDSDFSLPTLLQKDFQALEVNRREFFKFAKSDNNKTVE